MKSLQGILCLAAGVAVTSVPVFAQEARPMPPAVEVTVNYDAHIKPLLERSCVECHNEKTKKSKLRLDTREFVLQGGIEGPSVIVGDSANSNLVKILIGAMEDYEIMPPPDKHPPFTDEEIGLIRAWIDQGLVWGDDVGAAHPAEAAVPGLPEDWKAQATNQTGPLATWGLVQEFKGPDGQQLIGVTGHEAPGAETLNLLWTPKADFKDGGVSLLAKATGGAKAAGIAWRIKDNANYYAAVADWSGKSVSILLVQDGKATELAEVAAEGDVGDWAELQINHTGNAISVEAFGVSVAAENGILPDAGGVGYLAVGDTTAAFTAFKK